jgi:hypothetical protein
VRGWSVPAAADIHLEGAQKLKGTSGTKTTHACQEAQIGRRAEGRYRQCRPLWPHAVGSHVHHLRRVAETQGVHCVGECKRNTALEISQKGECEKRQGSCQEERAAFEKITPPCPHLDGGNQGWIQALSWPRRQKHLWAARKQVQAFNSSAWPV